MLFSMCCQVLFVPGLPAQQQETPAQKRGDRPEKVAKPIRLRMTQAVVCRSIDGHERYKVLPGAAQTAEEKLLLYYRPLAYRILQKDDFFVAHFTQDGQIRRKGEKTVLLSKKNILDYEVKSRQPLGPISLRNSVSLKGLAPGDYEYDITLRDENEPGPPAIQSVKFRVIAPVLPQPSKDAK